MAHKSQGLPLSNVAADLAVYNLWQSSRCTYSLYLAVKTLLEFTLVKPYSTVQLNLILKFKVAQIALNDSENIGTD